MLTYSYPQMPLLADIWYETDNIPPAGEPDRTGVHCSLSPLRPNEFFLADSFPGSLFPLHIIRTAADPGFCDNYIPPAPGSLFPTTLFEIPPGSEHWYISMFAHVVGAGFDNEHARVFVARVPNDTPLRYPLFRGWI